MSEIKNIDAQLGTKKEEKKENHLYKQIGKGWTGSIFYPTDKEGYVLKKVSKKVAIHCVKISKAIERRWNPKNGKIDDHFLLCDTEIRNFKFDPLPQRPLPQNEYGIYNKYGGLSWSNVYANEKKKNIAYTIKLKDINRVKHLIQSILFLHQCRIAHNDIHGVNILLNATKTGIRIGNEIGKNENIDFLDKPKLIDWDQSASHCLHKKTKKLHSQIPLDAGKIIFFTLRKRLFQTEKEQYSHDWNCFLNLIQDTWPNILLSISSSSSNNLDVKVGKEEQYKHWLKNCFTLIKEKLDDVCAQKALDFLKNKLSTLSPTQLSY